MKNSKHERTRSRKPVALALAVLLAASCQVISPGDLARGGLPNLDLPTLGGLQLWSDVAWSEGWRVQRHVWSRHCRLLDEEDTRRAWGSESYCVSNLPESDDEELVILLHGLGRTRESLSALQQHLEAQGHSVAALSYASTRASIDQHAAGVERVLDRMPDVERVSFVTHSLGGRVVLRLLEREGAWMERVELGGVVQIAPPNRGSALAAQLEPVPFLAALLGPSFLEVADASEEQPPADCPFAVIAGVRRTPGGWNPWLAEDDDGVVGVSETRANFPHEHLRCVGLHTFIMKNPEVLAATSRFLASRRHPPSLSG